MYKYLKNQTTLSLVSVAMLFFSGSCATQDDETSRLVRISLEKNAAEILKDPMINSLSIGIYKDGKAYTSHYGELSKGQGNTATDNTIYGIASVTKTFTGILTAQAVLDGKLRLDDDIRKYLNDDYPNFEFKDHPIRIKHLITHTSGFPANHKNFEDVPFDNEDGMLWKRLYEAEKNYSKEKFFKDIKDIKITQQPGTKFLYSNLSSNMMGHILEQVYNKSYAELLEQYIFGPAGMKSTKLFLSSAEKKKLASGYSPKGIVTQIPPLEESLWGAEGGLKSTLPDLIKYMKFQLSDNPAVVESHRRLHKLDDGYWMGYLWWVINIENGINTKDGVESYRHDGGNAAIRNVFIVYPEYQLGMSLITNVSAPHAFDELTKLGQRLLEDLK